MLATSSAEMQRAEAACPPLLVPTVRFMNSHVALKDQCLLSSTESGAVQVTGIIGTLVEVLATPGAAC